MTNASQSTRASSVASLERDVAMLRDALQSARDRLQEQDDVLKRIAEAPTPWAYVAAVRGDRAVLVTGSGLLDVLVPSAKDVPNFKVGVCVRVLLPTMAILEVVDSENVGGSIATVRAGKKTEAEIDYQGEARIIFHSFAKVPEAGDRLIVDPSCTVALRNLGKDETKFSFHGATGITWDDVGGLHQAKEALREAIELPVAHKELFAHYKKSTSRGLLLYGPPGCGKTMLAKAAATSLARTHGASASATGFIYVKGPALLNKYIGETEAQIRGLFARARAHALKHGYPAILFIDEADAILGRRGSRPDKGMETTVVPQFLSEMDGLEESGAFVLLATNRSDTLDSAVVREGRIDRKVHVHRPDQRESANILGIHLRNKPLAEGLKLEEISSKVAEWVFSPEHTFYNVTTASRVSPLTLGHLANGAMLAGIVDMASSRALLRDVGKGVRKASGMNESDLQEAVHDISRQNRSLDHSQVVDEFCENLKEKVVNIARA